MILQSELRSIHNGVEKLGRIQVLETAEEALQGHGRGQVNPDPDADTKGTQDTKGQKIEKPLGKPKVKGDGLFFDISDGSKTECGKLRSLGAAWHGDETEFGQHDAL